MRSIDICRFSKRLRRARFAELVRCGARASVRASLFQLGNIGVKKFMIKSLKPAVDMEEVHLSERGMSFASTDLGNSKRFIAQHGHELQYLWEEKRWVAWDGSRWRPNAKLYGLAEQTVKRIYDEARDCKNNLGQRELTDWARKSQAKSRIDPMLMLAAEALSVAVTDFDSDADVINCTNGVVDLRTGEIVDHAPEQRVMKKASAKYAKQSTCPQWLAFLRDVFQGDEELISYMQKALGYSITGNTNEQCLFIAYGLGSNGKTTLFETIHSIISDYGTVTEFATFLNTDKSDARKQEAVGRLRGMRMAIASETESTKSWKESTVKKLTGGDTLTGAKLYGSSYEFRPSHTLWFQANHLPGVRDASHSFWRRVRVIPFNAKFEGAKIDTGLRSRLLGERDGILTWLVQGAQQYYAEGLGKLPRVCEEVIAEYRYSNDVLGRFVSERLQSAFGQTVGIKETYDQYQRWCFKEKETSIPLNFFSKGMEERGIAKKRTSAGNVFVGVVLGEAAARPANDNWRPTLDPGLSVYDPDWAPVKKQAGTKIKTVGEDWVRGLLEDAN